MGRNSPSTAAAPPFENARRCTNLSGEHYETLADTRGLFNRKRKMVEGEAKAVSFLASDEASYVVGSELYVDGGVAQI